MAKYIVTHACGHQVEYRLNGAYSIRERRIAYLETCNCYECKKAQANALAVESKEKRGLPDLTGSEKQIAWANTIRECVYSALDKLTTHTSNEQAKQMVDNWREKMNNKTTAKFWIENRNNLPDGETAPIIIVQEFREVFGI